MTIAQISLGLIFFAVVTIVWGIVKIHTYPGKIAEARGHPQAQAIEVTSLLGLIVFPLWMAALVWAYSGAVVGTLYEPEGGGGEPEGESDVGGDPEQLPDGAETATPEATPGHAHLRVPQAARDKAGKDSSDSAPDGAADDAPETSERG